MLAWHAGLLMLRYLANSVRLSSAHDNRTSQCDLSRPTCGRCAQRGLICSGLPLDSIFIFRDENEVARRNSRRARRQQGEGSVMPVTQSRSFNSASLNWSTGAADNMVGPSLLQQQYPWLNEQALAEVPEPLKRDVETRAVERFFVNWTLHPSNHGRSPGKHIDFVSAANSQLATPSK